MNRFLFLCVSVCLIGCAAPNASKVSGLTLENFDRTVRPQDDLYRFANGNWIDAFEIPADKSSFGAFTHLYDRSQDNLKAIILDASAGRIGGESAQKVGDAYAAFMSEETIERAGLQPLRAERAKSNGSTNLERRGA